MGAPRKGFTEHYARLDTSDPDACWPWPGGQNGDGYGSLMDYYVGHRAHKYFYERIVGLVPKGLVLDHLCHDPSTCVGGKSCPHRACCNPKHLAIVTHRDNLLRGNTKAAQNVAKTECAQGHPYTEENTFVRPNRPNSRECRQCMRDRARVYHHRKKLAK